jgi:hypothetical protein
MVRQAYSMGRQALALINAEHKHIDVTASGSLSTTSGTLGPTLLSGIAQGDTAVTRDGNKIRLKAMDFLMRINASSSATRDTLLRLIIFKVKQPQGALPSATDVLGTTNEPISLAAWDTRGTIKILYDEFIHARTSAKKEAYTRIDLKLDMPQIFSGTSAAITDIETGAIAFMATYVTDATNATGYAYESRIVFMDN